MKIICIYIYIEFYKMEKSGHYPDMSIWIICSSTKRAFPFFKIVHQSNSQFATRLSSNIFELTNQIGLNCQPLFNVRHSTRFMMLRNRIDSICFVLDFWFIFVRIFHFEEEVKRCFLISIKSTPFFLININ